MSEKMTDAKHKGRSVSRFALTCLATIVLLVFACMFTARVSGDTRSNIANAVNQTLATRNMFASIDFDPNSVPSYSGAPSVEVNGNVPFFVESDYLRRSFEMYSAFDSLGRCGPAFALVGKETMPSRKRGSIGMIKPSGWQISEYDWIDGKYLYNRCHLIAYSLAGENENQYNLITGTRSMNTLGMLPNEERVAMYVDSTANHVLYRVTPFFEGDNLVASGVLMEARSIEDDGAGINFCVWCYNVEPGVVIDYASGDNRAGDPKSESYSDSDGGSHGGSSSVSHGDSGDGMHGDSGDSSSGDSSTSVITPKGLAGEKAADSQDAQPANGSESQEQTYVLNTNTHRFHYPYCSLVADMKEKNKQVVEGIRDELIKQGYHPCGVCNP